VQDLKKFIMLDLIKIFHFYFCLEPCVTVTNIIQANLTPVSKAVLRNSFVN